VSILYEDLQVSSSSSENSDGEWAATWRADTNTTTTTPPLRLAKFFQTDPLPN
jgi:hypothetical protein